MPSSDLMTVREMLRRVARWFPDNEAVVDEVSRLTYATLHDQARRCAALYHELGVRKGDRVALLLYPSVVHTIAYFGAVELGALPVGLHLRESPAVLSAVTERLSPRVLVYDGAHDALAAALLPRSPFVTGVIRARSAATPPGPLPLPVACQIPDDLDAYTPSFEPPAVSEHDPVTIVLSSGTTSLPKGIVHTNRTFMESARGALYFWQGIKPSDAILNVLTTSFIGWYNLSLPFLNVGAKNVFLHPWDPRRFLATLEAERVTAVFLAPTMWRVLFREDIARYDVSAVRMAYCAGEAMDRATLERIRTLFTPHVVNVYGSTETGSCSAGAVLFTEEMTPERATSVGKPLLNADIRIIRPGGTAENELPRGERGEVIIRGPSVAAAVWDDPAMTRKIFEGPDPWWHSGDIGHLDADGFLYVDGRTDDMIISGGININPLTVEDALLGHPAVAECAVIGIADPEWGQRVKAYVVPRHEQLTADELDAFLRGGPLSRYQRPRLYELVSQLPRTATGKLNRRALREAQAEPPVFERSTEHSEQ